MLKVTLDSWESLARGYALGMLTAAHHYVYSNPGWFDKIFQGVAYSVAWPYSLFRAIYGR